MKKWNRLLLSAAAVASLLLAESKRERRKVKKTVYKIPRNITPEGMHGKTVCFLTDFHESEGGHNNAEILRIVDDLKPSFLVLGGDIFNGRDTLETTGPAMDLIQSLADEYPVYYGIGNHEKRIMNNIYGNGEIWDSFLSQKPRMVQLLDNASEHFEQVCITGLDLPLIYYKRGIHMKLSVEDMNQMIGKKKEDTYTILLAHDPEYMDTYLKWGADLVLSGHFHGGMVRLPGLGGVISPHLSVFPSYDYGYYQNGNQISIISSGLGQHSIPVRLGNLPEVVVIQF